MDEMAIQSAHVGIVPRVGGLAIYLGLLGLIPLLYFGFVPLYVFDWNSEDMALIILSAFPVFCWDFRRSWLECLLRYAFWHLLLQA